MYKFIGTFKDAKRFAYPNPKLGQVYSASEYNDLMKINCNCLSKYFEKS